MHNYPPDNWQQSKKIHPGGKAASSTNGAGKTGCPHVEECSEIHIYHCTKVTSKGMEESKEIRVKPDEGIPSKAWNAEIPERWGSHLIFPVPFKVIFSVLSPCVVEYFHAHASLFLGSAPFFSMQIVYCNNSYYSRRWLITAQLTLFLSSLSSLLFLLSPPLHCFPLFSLFQDFMMFASLESMTLLPFYASTKTCWDFKIQVVLNT